MARAGRWLHALILTAVVVVVGVLAGLFFFLTDSRSIALAGHDAVVRPTLDNHAVVRTGPLLPSLRVKIDTPVGVDIELGATESGSPEELVERYAFIAAEPQSQVTRIKSVVVDMAIAAGLRGLVVGVIPVAFWLLLGSTRRRVLFAGLRRPTGALSGVALLGLPVLMWQPWQGDDTTKIDAGEWVSVKAFLADSVEVPDTFDDVQIRESTTTEQTKRLVMSAVDTYDKSKKFYTDAATAAADLEFPVPEDDQTVALVVSDRHDNIGMDQVAAAVAEQAGATVVLDAGDDTSTGQPWEAFSLDSLADTFADYERYAVAGNHDSGTFVRDYLVDAGWTMPTGEVIEGPGGGNLLGLDDPRSSGLGNWRDTAGASFEEVAAEVGEVACASSEPIATLLVHDANLGKVALERGCVDLVVGGHTHVQAGPDEVVSPEGAVGYSLTNGTTGGAAYAIAIGSKPRRSAHVSLITYREGRPIGVQWVELQTNGEFIVSDWVPITPHRADEDPADLQPSVLAAPQPRGQ